MTLTMKELMSDLSKDHEVAVKAHRLAVRSQKEAGHAYSDLVSTEAPQNAILAAWRAFDAAGEAVGYAEALVKATQENLANAN